MTKILHLDASARPHSSSNGAFGSHTRRLSSRFVQHWSALHPQDTVIYRDVGRYPPAPVSGEWIHAAFTPPGQRLPWMHEILGESDSLIGELLEADLIVAGVPMYNFNVPAQFKAYIDNIVRVGVTFGFDRKREGEPYWPLLAGSRKTAVVLSSRGDYGYDKGGRNAHMNHVERSIASALSYIGITDLHSVAVEYDEFSDERLAASIVSAEAKVDDLAGRLSRCGK